MHVPPELTKEAYRLQEALQRWLMVRYPQSNLMVVLAALTYEQARIVSLLSPNLPDRDLDEMLQGVVEIMRAHIRTYDCGDLPRTM